MSHPYDRLIIPDRLGGTRATGRRIEEEVQSDRGRITTSSAFRRLQTKAQVFSLEENASVRTRLTHSIEVATFGGGIAEIVSFRLDLSPELRFAFVKTVENACLVHDIGNPPFGHLGEYAIQRWFTDHLRKKGEDDIFPADVAENPLLQQYAQFDGNPQSMRIVTRLAWLDNEFGLNLTCSLLAALLKYLSTQKHTDRAFCKKIGYFLSERRIIEEIWAEKLNLEYDSAIHAPLQRHPLAFISEAADDIAYCLTDIEDALEKRIYSEGEFFAEIGEIAEPYCDRYRKSLPNARNAKFAHFKIKLTVDLIKKAAEAYIANHDSILNGLFDKPLLSIDLEAKTILQRLKDYARRRIFVAQEAQDIELSGYAVVKGLLDEFSTLLRLSTEEFRQVLGHVFGEEVSSHLRRKYPRELRLISFLANKHVLNYKHQIREGCLFAKCSGEEWEHLCRTQLVIDYISGMTDSHALKVFQMLKGISVGVRA